MAVYKAATKDEANMWHGIAEDWITSQNPGNMFHDGRTGFKLAVAEYLANQEGKTIYEGGVGQDFTPLPSAGGKKKPRAKQPPKPASEPLRVLNWNDCMGFLEQKYGWETEGRGYPVMLLYSFLDYMDYIPKGNCRLTVIEWVAMSAFIRGQDYKDEWYQVHYKQYSDCMTAQEYRDTLAMIICTVIDEFSLDNDNAKIHWSF